MSHTFNFGKHLVGDPFSGTVYELTDSVHTEAGNPIRGFRVSPVVFDDNKWVYIGPLEFNIQTGQTPDVPLFDGNNQPRPAQAMLRWSKDAGRTWSNTYTLSLGFQGEYEKRVIKPMMGRARKLVVELSWSDPVGIAIAEAFLEGEPEVA